MLSEYEQKRYSRQIMLDEIGLQGQEMLSNSKVLVVGTGGLASPVLYYLAAAGVGNIEVIDYDTVELSNFNRQIIHTEKYMGKPKIESVINQIKEFNSSIDIKGHKIALTSENAGTYISSYDVVIDCVDNLGTRYIVNDTCCRKGIPLVEAGVSGFEGYVMTILPGRSPCFRCIYPDNRLPKKTDVKPGVLGVTAGIAGTLQAAEAIKIILGMGEPLFSGILTFNALSMKFEKIGAARVAGCLSCGHLSKQ